MTFDELCEAIEESERTKEKILGEITKHDEVGNERAVMDYEEVYSKVDNIQKTLIKAKENYENNRRKLKK